MTTKSLFTVNISNEERLPGSSETGNPELRTYVSICTIIQRVETIVLSFTKDVSQ